MWKEFYLSVCISKYFDKTNKDYGPNIERPIVEDLHIQYENN